MSLLGLMMGAAVLIAFALLGMRLAPSYIEFFAIKKAVNAIAAEKRGNVAEVRKAFENRSTIDDISSVKASDLEITKDGISVSYRKELPLFKGIGIYIDFYVASTE
ncbi:MAG: DUF4845 domain-containing protein [Burkholderiales bacterium]